ncbi:MAG: hypothetical protein QG646_4389 [Euryarchaeota archaeon]|nr:hypothetical protein [Euryarchaeota archaeon]
MNGGIRGIRGIKGNNGGVNMSEFEAYNEETGKWEIFPLSRWSKIQGDKRYNRIVVNPDI